MNTNNPSRYYELDELCKLIDETENNLSLIYANSWSLLKNNSEYQSLFDYVCSHKQFKFDVMCFVETWLSQENSNLAQFEGYNHIMKLKPITHRGGGLSIFINENLQYKQRCDLIFENHNPSHYDCLFIEIVTEGSKDANTVIGLVYRSPSHNNEGEFVSSLERVLSKLSQEKQKEIIILGDFNMDLLKANNNRSTTYLLDMIMNFHFTPKITVPTRVTHNSASLIDHMYKNITERKNIAGTLISDITDHYINFMFIETNITSKEYPKTVTYRPMTDANVKKLNDSLKKTNWTGVLSSNDPNEAYNMYLKIYQTALDSAMPIKTVPLKHKKHKKQPWITLGILKSIQTKSKLFKQKIRTQNEQQQTIAINKYNRYRNILNRVIKAAKRLYWDTVFTESKNDVKLTWKYINTILQRTQNKVNFPDSFRHNGNILTENKHIANAFNMHYINVGPTIANEIPNTTIDIDTMSNINNPHSFFLIPTTPEEIEKVINKLKPKTSCGFDEINSKIIKKSSMVIAIPLAHIINLSLEKGIVPDQMKIAKVIPIYKSKESDQMKNYRPISLLPSFSKILEKIVYNRLYTYLQEKQLLYKSQYGFRKNLSTELATLEFQNIIINYMQSKKQCLGLFLDLSKAFDSLQHNILLAKMQKYGIRGLALNWFESYLSGRRQYTNYKGINSEYETIVCGVPQGSVIGPLLFLIYTNDLPNISNNAKFVLFADDTNIIIEDNSIESLENKVNDILIKVGIWFNVNKLSINISKTKFILFTRKPYTQVNQIEIKLNNILIEQTDHIKFLGVTIQHNFSWEIHIRNIGNKVSQVNSNLSRLKNILPRITLETIYRSLVEPYLMYGTVAWGNAPNKYLNRLKVLQKRSIRHIAKTKYNSHTDPIFRTKRILKFEDIVKLNCCKLYHRKIHATVPQYHISQLLTHEQSVQSHMTTRQCQDIYIHPIRNELSKQTINYSVGHTWNNLPLEIREKHNLSLSRFSNIIKDYYISKYSNRCTLNNCYICMHT